MNGDYKEAIIAAVNSSIRLSELYDMTIRFKINGLLQADAYCTLEEVRAVYTAQDEAKEDLILELMDYVVGCCQVKFYIWDDVLKV